MPEVEAGLVTCQVNALPLNYSSVLVYLVLTFLLSEPLQACALLIILPPGPPGTGPPGTVLTALPS